MRVLLYIVSLLIPLAGIIIGVIFYMKPEPEYKHVGKNCLIIGAVVILLSVVLSLMLFVMVVGFGGV